MENSIKKTCSYLQEEKEKSTSSNNENGTNKDAPKTPKNKNEINSWDCSTPSSIEKISKKKTNNWDSSSECQETLVEPFDNNENPKDSDNWDSESENKPKNIAEGKQPQSLFMLSTDSYDLSPSDFDKSLGSLEEQSRGGDLLFVEDFDEFLKDDGNRENSNTKRSPHSHGTSDLGTHSEKVRSKQSEGTLEDTTVWMIPKSERIQCRESTSTLISSSVKEKLEKLEKFSNFLKKARSLSDVKKSKSRRSSRSEYLGSQKNNYNNFFACEGSELKRKLEIESKKIKENISGCESFDRTRVFFTEYECRTMTMDKDTSEKLFPDTRSVFNDNEEVPFEDANENQNVTSIGRNLNGPSEADFNESARAGPSGITSMDVVSLPDMIGRKSLKQRKNQNSALRNKEVVRLESPESRGQSRGRTQMSESWLLLDDTGQYQEVTRNEVSILLNGRSADAVLQGRKEHFLQNVTLNDTMSLKESIGSMLAQRSLQYVLKEEDLGGEDDRRKIIDLERKVENTLFYITPGMNHTASVRIIPLETEMIHLWRRTRDGSSVQSLEVNLVNSSLDSVNTLNQRHPSDNAAALTPRPFVEPTVTEQDENQPSDSTTVNRHTDPVLPGFHESDVVEYSKLLFETRKIVDTLTNNFKLLHNRLEGEVTRNISLQGEVNKLMGLLKNCGGRIVEKTSREVILPVVQPSPNPSSSFVVIKENSDIKSESYMEDISEETYSKVTVYSEGKSASFDFWKNSSNQFTNEPQEMKLQETNDIITVDIYTEESFINHRPCTETTESCTIIQSNLSTIESKMTYLQQQNDVLVKQNIELKKKLKEISLELEKYLSGTSDEDTCAEEGREMETLRDQVCTLKLELENLKTLLSAQKAQLTQENSLAQEESARSLLSLKDWCTMTAEVFKKLEAIKGKLQETEILIDLNLQPEMARNPRNFSNAVNYYLEQMAQYLVKLKNENSLIKRTLKEDTRKESKEISGLDQVISGYADLIEQCRKDKIKGETESKVMEDYFTVIMEKVSLVDEIKILKTENEMLLESQLEHYEKLKQTMIALKDRKSEITALESSQKLLEDERSKMVELLKSYEEEKKSLGDEITVKSKFIEELTEEIKGKNLEIVNCNEKLNAKMNEIESFEKSCRLKDEFINELKMKNNELLTADGMKNNHIQVLKDEVKKLEIQGTKLEAELTSSKLFLNESQKEMTAYITHLEGLINNSQESLDKVKQKLKESNQTINRLKNENDVLEKQHQCDVKLFNNTKDELDSCKEKLFKTDNKLKESEEEREKFYKKFEILTDSEREKSEALEVLAREYKAILEENAELLEKVQIFSKDKDESLKEQKDLINKYAMLSKEIQKLQDKYRSVKSECNERTDLIRYLEMMLKENILEYNNRIACLEQNISQIIEKIIACKNGMKEKHFGVDVEVRELRHQLDVTCQERKEMESIVTNYYSLTKHLEHEIQEKEKKVDELHAKLSSEQNKAVDYKKETKPFQSLEPPRFNESSKIKQLESQLAKADRELLECKRELQHCQTNYENEKKKLELTIADLRSETKRYQLRNEVMMRNFSNCNKNMNCLIPEKRDDSDLQAIRKEVQEKNQIITELNDTINKYKVEVKLKDSALENSNKKSLYLDEEIKNFQKQIVIMQEAMRTTDKTTEHHQKEKDKMAEKLFRSLKLVMEERSARQTIESLMVEKEKNFKNQIDEIKNELLFKSKECEEKLRAFEEEKKLVSKLQNDLEKMKGEVYSLKVQSKSYKKRICQRENGNHLTGKKQSPYASPSLMYIRPQNISVERLESCLKELKEIRDLNLQLRKMEGQYQTKIVQLEDEIRDARLLIKELQGDIKTEKKSKKAFKSMIIAAKLEIEKCVLANQLMPAAAEKISRHLDLSEIPSREFLSGFRLSDAPISSKFVLQ